MRGEKLHKVLAANGYGSRREIESWILSGRISVNGDLAHVGQRVLSNDEIQLDGKLLQLSTDKPHRVLIYNKPEGQICSRHDPQGRSTVFDALPWLSKGKWVSIGRLDIRTTGLLIFTTDGTLANRMMHPKTGLDREYAVRIDGKLTSDQESELREGVAVEGMRMSFSDLRYYNGRGLNHWYHVVLMEGLNREVRRLFLSIGFRVSRLKRVRFGPIILPSTIRRGQLVELGIEDLSRLYDILGLSKGDLNFKSTKRKNQMSGKNFDKSCLIPYPKIASE